MSSIVTAKTILVLGDSISAAYNLNKIEDGWVYLLQQRLPNHKIINAAISGDTTTGGLNRLPQLLTEYEPQIVIIELGGNDGLRGTNLNEVKNNLTTMINLTKKIDAKVLLAAVQLPPNYGVSYNQKFSQIYKDVAQSENVALTQILDDLDISMIQADGIHPTEQAQSLLMQNIYTGLKDLLE